MRVLDGRHRHHGIRNSGAEVKGLKRGPGEAILTDHQALIFEALLDGERRRRPHSLREISEIAGYDGGNVSTILSYLNSLARKGLARNKGKLYASRGWAPVHPARDYAVFDLGDGRHEVFRAVKVHEIELSRNALRFEQQNNSR